jgi:hypothetical protein
MSLELTTHAEPPEGWLELARECGVFYHHPAWIGGLGACYGLRITYLAARADGRLVGGLPLAEVPALFGPRRLVSLPFGYAAGPLARSGESDVADRLAHGALDLARRRGLKRVEIKQVAPAGAAPAGFTRVTHYAAFRVSTAGGESAIWRRLHASSTQRSIRKGEKSGVEVAIGQTESDWCAMAELEERTAHGHGVPAPPRRFFLGHCRDLQRAGLAELYLARVPGRGVAAGIVVWKGWREWIYAFGASRPELLEYRPNHVLIWRALREAAAADVTFDLGRAAPEQEGLVEFKRRWGGEPVPLAYDYWPSAAGLNVARRDTGPLALAARVWTCLPASIARRGSALYRYLG